MMNENLFNIALPPEQKPRHKLRLAAIGGIAAIAIIGGGVTAVASAAAPAVISAGSPSSAPASSAPTTGTPTTGTPTRPTPKPHLDGTVTQVSDTTVLIKDRAGFTRTIVLSSTTTYSDGLKAALATGTKIRAEGTVDSNGTSLDATTVSADKGPMGGRGGGFGGGHRGGPGHGGSDGRGDHLTPPADGSTGTSPAAPTTSSAAPTA